MIDIYSASSNLGDNLSLTPLCYLTKCRVHMYDDASCRAIAPIFDGLAEVIFDNGSPSTHGPAAGPEAAISGPHSAKTLAQFGFAGKNAIPRIKLTADEISWARHFLSDCQLHNACVVKASTQQINYRTPPAGLIESIVDQNPNISFVTSALSSSHPKNNFVHIPIRGALTMWDYKIRKLAALYSVIGRYIGPDTGDMHLMLAVGGKVDVLVPKSAWHYDHNHFHYRDIDFVDELPRARYHHWDHPLGESITNIKL